MMLRGNGSCCPVCSQGFRGGSLKYHIKSCARNTLAQLTTCPHCGRPVQHEDLAEHAKRCKSSASRTALDDQSRKIFLEKCTVLRATLAKIEAGEICNLDSRGFFVCGVCGQDGLALNQILGHEEECRRRLAADGSVPVARPPPIVSVASPQAAARPQSRSSVSAAFLKAALASLQQEVDSDGVGNYVVCTQHLREVVTNACCREEKKYRRLRLSNASFAEAIGRWQAAQQFLVVLGFELTMRASSQGAEPEAYLVRAERLAEEDLRIALDVLDGKEPVPVTEVEEQPAITTAPEPSSGSGLLEACFYCGRFFRFDRLAKHETRCQASRPAQPKFDFVSNVLAGTPGEQHIREVKRMHRDGNITLEPLGRKTRNGLGTSSSTSSTRGFEACPRCGRQFGEEALARHVKHCKGNAQAILPSANLTPRTGTSAAERPATASSPASSSRPRSASTRQRAGQAPEVAATSRPGSRNRTAAAPDTPEATAAAVATAPRPASRNRTAAAPLEQPARPPSRNRTTAAPPEPPARPSSRNRTAAVSTEAPARPSSRSGRASTGPISRNPRPGSAHRPRTPGAGAAQLGAGRPLPRYAQPGAPPLAAQDSACCPGAARDSDASESGHAGFGPDEQGHPELQLLPAAGEVIEATIPVAVPVQELQAALEETLSPAALLPAMVSPLEQSPPLPVSFAEEQVPPLPTIAAEAEQFDQMPVASAFEFFDAKDAPCDQTSQAMVSMPGSLYPAFEEPAAPSPLIWTRGETETGYTFWWATAEDGDILTRFDDPALESVLPVLEKPLSMPGTAQAVAPLATWDVPAEAPRAKAIGYEELEVDVADWLMEEDF